MSADVLEMFVVYDHPRDYPDEFVVRRWRIGVVPRVPVPDGDTPRIRGRTLEEVRRQLPPGLVCLARNPGDDPVIVETWL